MAMHVVGRLVGVGALLAGLGLAGCDGGSVEVGAPKNVDMAKDYSPSVDMPGMSPKAAAKAKTAPAPTK